MHRLGIDGHRQPGAHVDRIRLAHRPRRHRERGVVWDQYLVVAVVERHVQQPMRRDRGLHVHAEPGEAHPVADLERPCREQDDAGEDVPERLLGGQAEHHGREARARRERAWLEAGQAQADQRGAHERHELHEEAGDPSRAGLQSSHIWAQTSVQRPPGTIARCPIGSTSPTPTRPTS
jgi:hypothetical protein